MTAFVAKNATESIGLIRSDADPALTGWIEALAQEYSSLPVGIYELAA